MTILGVTLFSSDFARREETSSWAQSKVRIATRLSSHVIGASPQSTILAQERNGSRPEGLCECIGGVSIDRGTNLCRSCNRVPFSGYPFGCQRDHTEPRDDPSQSRCREYVILADCGGVF